MYRIEKSLSLQKKYFKYSKNKIDNSLFFNKYGFTLSITACKM